MWCHTRILWQCQYPKWEKQHRGTKGLSHNKSEMDPTVLPPSLVSSLVLTGTAQRLLPGTGTTYSALLFRLLHWLAQFSLQSHYTVTLSAMQRVSEKLQDDPLPSQITKQTWKKLLKAVQCLWIWGPGKLISLWYQLRVLFIFMSEKIWHNGRGKAMRLSVS